MPRADRKVARSERVKAREEAWVRAYEKSQGAALGDPDYHLPTKAELLQLAERRR